MEDLEKLLTWNVASNWLDEIDNFSFSIYSKTETSNNIENEIYEIYHRVGELAHQTKETYPFEQIQNGIVISIVEDLLLKSTVEFSKWKTLIK